ncbi:MAG: Na+/Picotransporter [Firmicutes bacterium HGW-Firmicutes-14]|nr:MAG: Na+/Picotransporter [Firmicutes bacterium HGW-Firmicutes-14]
MQVFSNVLGGIGVFLLGMTLLANGLKALAGDALRRGLSRFTGGTLSAILSGAGTTALIQSSSATTLTTIGFVSAGLLTFPQAVGVIFGSNLGTTSTGWIVSLIGLKLNISAVALPLVGVGVLFNLFSRGRYSSLGMAVAGFGLIFVGIDLLRAGMESVVVDPGIFPGDTVWNRLVLVLVGVFMTFVMQSSSAAMVTTLAALHSGAIVLDQAAALVIGQNVGTTVTAGLASVGGSVPAKRTALAHVLFNLITGVAAFLILPLFIFAVSGATRIANITDPAVALAAFHTVFNILGLILLVPVMRQFIGVIIRIIPDRGPQLTRHLDPTVAEVAPVAVEAARRTLVEIMILVLEISADIITKRADLQAAGEKLDAARAALSETRRFLGLIRTDSSSDLEYRRHLSALHAVDHLEQLVEHAVENDYSGTIEKHNRLRETAQMLMEAIMYTVREIKGPDTDLLLGSVQKTSQSIADRRRSGRVEVLHKTAKGKLDPETGLAEINAMIWLDRLAYHLWRMVAHLVEDSADGSNNSSGTVMRETSKIRDEK